MDGPVDVTEEDVFGVGFVSESSKVGEVSPSRHNGVGGRVAAVQAHKLDAVHVSKQQKLAGNCAAKGLTK